MVCLYPLCRASELLIRSTVVYISFEPSHGYQKATTGSPNLNHANSYSTVAVILLSVNMSKVGVCAYFLYNTCMLTDMPNKSARQDYEE